jgi:hypothetical protein
MLVEVISGVSMLEREEMMLVRVRPKAKERIRDTRAKLKRREPRLRATMPTIIVFTQ